MRRLPALFLFLGLACGAFSLGSGSADPQALSQRPSYRFGVRVELVNVFATVHDRSGKLVTNLNQNDFLVYDNDVLQPISQFSREYMPLSVVILLDTSSSMAGRKLDNAKRSLIQFLKRLNPGDEAMLMKFETRPVVLQPFTPNLGRVKRLFKRLEGNGSTALYDAILAGIEQSRKAGNRRRTLLLVSDGINTYGSAELKETILELRRSGTELFAIGLETDLPEDFQYKVVTRAVLDQLTRSAGGEAFIVKHSRDLEKICEEISDRMHNQYTFGYYPPGTEDGKWHSIRIETRDPSLRVVASKRGYFPARP